ncbi:MAG: glycosyl transferase, partial [Chitinophagaceae bacterium]
FGALTMVVVWQTTHVLGGNLFAKILSAVAILFSAVLRLNILYQPNSFDILCWTFLYFSFLRYIQSKERKWLMAAAICFAIAFLNKYSIVFLICGMVPALLISPHRNIFSKPVLMFSCAFNTPSFLRSNPA